MMSENKTFTEETIVRKSQDILASDLEDEVVMMCVESGVYFGAKNVAAVIWRFIYVPRTVVEICQYLTERYEIDAALCYKQTVAYLEDLNDHQLLEIMPS